MDEVPMADIKKHLADINGTLLNMERTTHSGVIYELTIAWLLRYKDNPGKQRRALNIHLDALQNLFDK